MANKKKPSQLSLRLGIDDERVPKLVGIFALFLSVYLFIAFCSYLFTWKLDQDKVLRFSWELLLSNQHTMANWLGRLGAIASNFFFYWCFGLASFFLIYFGAIFGLNRLKRQPLAPMGRLFARTVAAMILLSISLELLFHSSEFPWGGAIGQTIYEWLERFIKNIGIVLLLLVSGIIFMVWRFNPRFDDLTLTEAIQAMFEFGRGQMSVTERMRRKRREAALAGRGDTAVVAVDEDDDSSGLRPSGSTRSTVPEFGKDKLLDMEVSGPELPNKRLPRGDQLYIPLEDVEAREKIDFDALEVGDDGLEVALPGTPTAEGLTPMLASTQENENHSEPYDPTLDLSSYEYPVSVLLEDYSEQKFEVDRAELEANKDQIIETLLNYKIEITKIRATIGPTVTLYEIVPAPGVRISKIKNLEDDIALSLAALGIRIIAPIPGRGTIGIEVPNKKKQMVSMKEVLMSDKFKQAKMDLPLAMGKTINNEVFVADLAKMPHLLIAGATGQGKSVGINAVIMSILYKKHPSQVKLVLIDPKKVELFPYAKLEQHFLAFLPDQDEPITTETTKVIHTLNSLCILMDQRYDLLKKAAVRNIKEYNEKFISRRLNPEKGHEFMPFIVLVIDEFADLIMTAGKEVELPIARLAQLSRAVGIHLVIATQRPSVNIITGVIKANFPARIAFKVTAKVDSRTILDAGGADQLIGRGDMLLSVGGEMVRVQGAFVDTPEVERVIDFIGAQRGYPQPYLLPEFSGDEEISGNAGLTYADLDENFEDAARLIVQQQIGSTSMIQRRLKLGYNRAGRIMDQLEAMGITGPSEGSKPREVLVYDENELTRIIQMIKEKTL